MSLVSNPKPGDDVSVRQAIARLGSSKLGPKSSPKFLGVTTTTLTITGLTTNSLIYPVSGLLTSLGVATNGQIPIGSTGVAPVLATITGTANQITSTPGAGSITLSTPQDIHSAATPTFAGLGIGTPTIPHGGVGWAKLAIDGTNASVAGPHIQFTTALDNYPLMQILNYRHDDISIRFDSYWDGANKSSDAGSNYAIFKISDSLKIMYDSGVAQGGAVAWNEGIVLNTSGLVTIPNTVSITTGIELGHASDTTITRVSAGVIAVEGTTIMLVGDAPTAHSIVSHNDTTGTGAELNTLTGGGDVGALHTHAAAYQPLDDVLTDLAALTAVADNEFIVGTGTGTYAHESGATARTSIGLGTGASPQFTGLTLSGLTQGSVVFAGASGAIAQDNSNLFWDDTNNRLGVGVNSDFDPRIGITVSGDIDILHTSSEADDHAFEIDVDAAGFGDVKSIDIDYITGEISAGKDEGIILLNIDQITGTPATGGEVFGLEVLATDGSANITGLKVGAVIDPVHQDSGTFANPTTATDNTTGPADVDAMKDGDSGTTTAIFEAQSEYVLIGAAAPFEEIEFILTTTSSGAGIKPTFWYSTAGAHQFTQFTPVDGTNAFRNTGVVAWDASDLTSHGINTDTGTYDIKVIRTRVSLSTPPVLGYAKTAATTEYIWDKNGDVNINSLTLAGLTLTNAVVIGSNSVIFRPAVDSTTFLQAFPSGGGDPVLNIDTVNGNAGFGTATPGTIDSTQISQSGRTFFSVHDEDNNAYLTLSSGKAISDQTTFVEIHFGGTNEADAHGIKAVIRVKADGVTAGKEGGALIIATKPNNNSTLSERLRITAEGDVGINDSAPGEKLDVDGNANVTGVYKVDDVQVVGNQAAAIANATDAASVITQLNDLLAKCRTHGIIAT